MKYATIMRNEEECVDTNCPSSELRIRILLGRRGHGKALRERYLRLLMLLYVVSAGFPFPLYLLEGKARARVYDEPLFEGSTSVYHATTYPCVFLVSETDVIVLDPPQRLFDRWCRRNSHSSESRRTRDAPSKAVSPSSGKGVH